MLIEAMHWIPIHSSNQWGRWRCHTTFPIESSIAHILIVQTNEANKDAIPPFQLNLQLSTHKTQVALIALLDSRIDQNIISYNLWDALQQPKLSSSTIAFQSFSKSTTMSQGKFCLKLCIRDQSMHTTFHVAQNDQASVDMTLGQSWISQTSCLIDWSSISSIHQLCEHHLL